MKSPSRRLGRGLGAFLDFGPADEDGAARIEGVLSAGDATSVIETSAAPVPRKHSPVAKPAPRSVVPAVAAAAPTPAPAPVAAAAVVAPAPEEPLFDDEFVVADGLFGDAEPAAAEVTAVAEVPAVPKAPVVAVQEPVAAAEPATVVDDSVFIDDVVGGLAFPDVELE
jgi:hypothetical protein